MHVKNKYIGEGGRLISDILEINNAFNLRGYILTVDIEKAFDSLCHSFLLPCLKKLGFGYDFIRWVTILVESQESYIINAYNELQCHTSVLKKVRARMIQFLRIFLIYVLKFYFCLLKLIIKYET